MTAFDLIRERWHSDNTAPAERAFLIEVIAALHKKIKEAAASHKEKANDHAKFGDWENSEDRIHDISNQIVRGEARLAQLRGEYKWLTGKA